MFTTREQFLPLCIIHMAIFGALFAKVILILFKKTCLEVFPTQSVEERVWKFLKTLKLDSPGTLLSLFIAGLVLFNVLFIK